MSLSAPTKSQASRCLRPLTLSVVALLCVCPAASAAAQGHRASRSARATIAQAASTGDTQTGTPAPVAQEPSASASVEQCVTGAAQSERSAMFAAEMTAMPGSVRMAIRVEIQEQIAGEALFHTITASGLGAWRVSDPGVRAYRYNKQVTNLFAPASYRAAVRFRWLNAKGRLMKSSVRHTPGCRQTASTPFPGSASTEVSSSVARMP